MKGVTVVGEDTELKPGQYQPYQPYIPNVPDYVDEDVYKRAQEEHGENFEAYREHFDTRLADHKGAKKKAAKEEAAVETTATPDKAKEVSKS
jgi:hypothetical protein